MKQTNNPPSLKLRRTSKPTLPVMKLKTFNVWHGSKMIGQVTAPDANDAYLQAREHHKIPLAVIGRKEAV